MKKRILKILWIQYYLDLLEVKIIKQMTKELWQQKRDLDAGMVTLSKIVIEHNKKADDIFKAYVELHKQFKWGADISPRDWSWAVVAFRKWKQDIVKFYSLRDWQECAKFIENNRYNNPSIDAPLWFFKY